MTTLINTDSAYLKMWSNVTARPPKAPTSGRYSVRHSFGSTVHHLQLVPKGNPVGVQRFIPCKLRTARPRCPCALLGFQCKSKSRTFPAHFYIPAVQPFQSLPEVGAGHDKRGYRCSGTVQPHPRLRFTPVGVLRRSVHFAHADGWSDSNSLTSLRYLEDSRVFPETPRGLVRQYYM